MRPCTHILLQLRSVQPATPGEFVDKAWFGVSRPRAGQVWGAAGNLARARRSGHVRRDKDGRYSLTKKGEALLLRHGHVSDKAD